MIYLYYQNLKYETGAETQCQKWGGSVFMKFTIYIHSKILHSSFDPLTTKFWGAQPPLTKKWGGSSPPCPPQVLCLCENVTNLVKAAQIVSTGVLRSLEIFRLKLDVCCRYYRKLSSPKIDGVTRLMHETQFTVVKRLGRKDPSYCLVNRQEIVLTFIMTSIFFRQLFFAQGEKSEYWLFRPKTAVFGQ